MSLRRWASTTLLTRTCERGPVRGVRQENQCQAVPEPYVEKAPVYEPLSTITPAIMYAGDAVFAVTVRVQYVHAFAVASAAPGSLVLEKV